MPIADFTNSPSELSQEDRAAVEAMDIDLGIMECGTSSVWETVALGDEGFDISHEGGEYEVFEELAEGVAGIAG